MTPEVVFSCKIYEIFKNIYFEEHLRKTASVKWIINLKYLKFNMILVWTVCRLLSQ